MTNQQHPITPPAKLVEQWYQDGPEDDELVFVEYVATQAAQWGADQELKACCEWLRHNWPGVPIEVLRAARCPKPKNQAEEAIAELDGIMDELHEATDSAFTASTIRAALKRLQELEKLSDNQG